MGSLYASKDTSVFYTRGPVGYRSPPSIFGGVVADCASVSRWVRLGFLLILLACLFHLIGFTTPGWLVPDAPFVDPAVGLTVTGIGLWEICGTHEFTSVCVFVQSRDAWQYGTEVRSGWFYAVQILVVVAVFLSIVPISLLILYMIRRNLARRKVVLLVATLFSIVTGAAILVAVILYGVNMSDYGLGWSFILTVIGGSLFILGTVPLIPDLVRSRRRNGERLR